MTRPPLTYFGNKARLSKQIIEHFPPHSIYVEVFGGSAAVLFAKPPAKVGVLNDLDGELVNFCKVVRTPSLLAQLISELELTLYSREEFELAQHGSSDPVERARRMMVRHRQSHSGLGANWSYSIKDSSVGMASSVRRWHAGIERLFPAHTRLRNVQVEHRDFREIFNRFDSLTTLFYVDPPYPASTRMSGKYKYEMTMDDHRELMQILVNLKGKTVLSTYEHDVHQPLREAGW